ncbi:hypothetical protein [Microseira sp. BLCC-F43]|jgi:hypothetical protein|uniref:hypothetical protein n=1 Tax=Microseira sp. BLCC-F43 TaxID=3153602 RepID=UPI0035B920EA
MAFNTQADWERQEAYQYRPGQRVELKQRPGVVDTIAEYDPMMVPPIQLVNDPQPRYPEELNVMPKVPTHWFGEVGQSKLQSRNSRYSSSRVREKAIF